MITFLDVETTFQINPNNRRSDPSPFHNDNKLVSVQYATDAGEPVFKWFYHEQKQPDTQQNHKDVIYTRWFWRWIMFIVKTIPESVFKKLNF